MGLSKFTVTQSLAPWCLIIVCPDYPYRLGPARSIPVVWPEAPGSPVIHRMRPPPRRVHRGGREWTQPLVQKLMGPGPATFLVASLTLNRAAGPEKPTHRAFEGERLWYNFLISAASAR